jgi:hypothetical protein
MITRTDVAPLTVTPVSKIALPKLVAKSPNRMKQTNERRRRAKATHKAQAKGKRR